MVTHYHGTNGGVELDRGSSCWDSVIEDQLSSPQPSRRAYVDALHQDLVARWLSDIKPCRLLKTDLYEECVGNGLAPILHQPTVFAVGMDVSSRSVHVTGRRHSGRSKARDPFEPRPPPAAVSLSDYPQ
jgi:hypothetical protein